MRDIEQHILSWLKTELDRLGPSFAAAGLSCREPEIEVWPQHNDYTCEIRLMILRKGQIDDVLEFEIYRDGKAVVTAEEAIEWLRLELAKKVP